MATLSGIITPSNVLTASSSATLTNKTIDYASNTLTGVVDKAAWATYRQALRDISGQAGFPWNVTWPDDPFKKSPN